MESHNDGRMVRVLTALCCEPWLITPQMHRTLTEIVLRHVADPTAAHAVAGNMEANPAKRAYALQDGIAIIPLEGVIGRKFSTMLYSSGVTSVDVFQRLVDTAAADSEVKGIMLMVDSPGGVVSGTPEAAEAVRRANKIKPTLAYADGMMDSAAYWIASQAGAIYATQSADVGSIGTYMALLDYSRQMEMQGVRAEIFKSGKHKAMGFPGTSLSDEQREMLRDHVNKTGAQFKAYVREGRARDIPDDAMQGQSFTSVEALEIGLIDAISDASEAMRDLQTLASIAQGGRR